MSNQQCPCAELDWRDVDQTQPHHPDCKAKATVNINVAVHGSLIHESQLRDVIRNAIWQTKRISTPAYEDISTAEAMHILLNILKWPKEKRRLKGETIISFWCIDNDSAFRAIRDLIELEGPGASLYEDETGNVVFEKGN